MKLTIRFKGEDFATTGRYAHWQLESTGEVFNDADGRVITFTDRKGTLVSIQEAKLTTCPLYIIQQEQAV